MPNEAIYGVVLLAAFAHALWNAMVKASDDRSLALTTIRAVGLSLGCLLIFFAPIFRAKS